ncbi:MAG: T9SS type A sorting domain-containing protein [Bacteroidota bacterium]
MKKKSLFPRFSAVVFKRITVVTLFVLFFSFSVCCQTTNISGIVNTYHKVIEIIPSKACVRVTNIARVNINSRVVLVQMKGASIITTNTSTFGDTTSLNGAGNYEIGTVCYIIGDSVFLFHNLLNTYNTSTGKVQLVQFAEYTSADIVDTVKAASWDSTAGTGGVIAIYSNQDIILNAPIYADSSGYRGGVYIHHAGDCPFVGTGYAYDASATGTQNGAYKGECVADIPFDKDGAKGAPANGGGGGNNHNNSGAGGANLTAGGNGGANSSGVPFGCYNTGNYGRGGKALSSWGGTKIFLGGGAGAGHANNGSITTNYGGNGGGIIFLWANNLIGNGKSISANGGKGGDSFGDGAGGGGAGGTMILHITNYIGGATIVAKGGAGGDSYNDVSQIRCFGGGGGGSGGLIYFTGTTPATATISTIGGAGGLEPNRNGSCLAPVPGTPGSNGTAFSNYNFSRSTDPAGYCRLLLPVKLISFTASAIDRKVLLQWQIDNPADVKSFIIERSVTANQWMALKTIPGHDQKRDYSTIDETPLPGRIYYRIKFIEKNNSFSYSPVRQVTIAGKNEFVIYPNPATNRIIIAGNYNYPADMKLLDISGKIIFQKNILTSPATIDLPYLPAGIYMLRVNQAVQKLIIR